MVKKLALSMCMAFLVVTAHASVESKKQITQQAETQSYLKQQIKKKRIDNEQWNKQAIAFIGLKRCTSSVQNTFKKPKNTVKPTMLTAQNLQEFLSNI